MSWWTENQIRMIQNNLRDVDARMDIDQYVNTLLEFGANTCMVGCGGITAFYPTELACQIPNPYMEGDFFGTLIKKCHENGIRVIARFDFSKTNISLYEDNKDWYTVSIHGNPVIYNDTVATCVNGRYQQEHSLEILEEVIQKYPVDGVFFNMFGYQTRDYSDNYTGICQCESCKSRFKTYSGMELPSVEDREDRAYQIYQTFKQYTVDELLDKIKGTVKRLNPDVSVCTYNHKGVDLVRNESNSAVDRPYPFWLYASENNVSVVRSSFQDLISSNCVINAVDIYYRFMGVSKYLNAIRLYGEMAAGGGLDWCIIGSFAEYPDRSNFASTKEVFQFHKRYEEYFKKLRSQAKILLVNPSPFHAHSKEMQEYLGIFKMLKEEHRLFDAVDMRQLDEVLDTKDQYEVVILPGIRKVSTQILRKLQTKRICVVATGLALQEETDVLKEFFGVTLGEKLDKIRSAYLLTEPKEVFAHFPDRDWVYVDKEYRAMVAEDENESILPLIAPSRYGPPERCYGHVKTEQASVSVKNNRWIYYPWQVGSLYCHHGYEDFKYLLLDVLNYVRPIEECLTTNAPKAVEIFLDHCGENRYLLQLLNLSGFNGTTVYEPIPIHDIEVTLHGVEPQRIYVLGQNGITNIAADSSIKIPRLDQYMGIVIEM